MCEITARNVNAHIAWAFPAFRDMAAMIGAATRLIHEED
jgi:hypothetical protein